MAKVNSIIELIGNTPLVRINKLNDSEAVVSAQVEAFNPLSSVKDRVALNMVESAEKEGKRRKASVIIAPTSGNTGVGLAYVAAVKGYRVILTMPETMSVERRKLLAALGAELVLTDGKAGMKGAIEKANEIAAQTPGSFIPQQFENPANPEAHIQTTGPEIWKDTEGKVDIFVSAAGTGGTVTGVGTFLKSKNPNVQIVAVEPDTSAVLSGKPAGPHKIQGIGAGFVPKTYNPEVVDEIYLTNDVKAGNIARRAAKEEGLLGGISAGAALEAAVTIAKRPENKGKTIVALLPNTGERYLSIWLFES